MEAAAGFEPANEGFADPSLTTWVRRPDFYYERSEGSRNDGEVNNVSAKRSGVDSTRLYHRPIIFGKLREFLSACSKGRSSVGKAIFSPVCRSLGVGRLSLAVPRDIPVTRLSRSARRRPG